MFEVLAALSVCSGYMLESRMIDVPKGTPMDMLDMHGKYCNKVCRSLILDLNWML